MARETRRPLRHFGMAASQHSHFRLAIGWMPTSAITTPIGISTQLRDFAGAEIGIDRAVFAAGCSSNEFRQPHRRHLGRLLAEVSIRGQPCI